ncbi:MAG: hypothetical protein OJF51_001394 [Nitrospira sp.]|jgi:hypothetical protein|nr:MAG: hypothetical protein OJF51_001394 [Nitrospira sp.]
MNDRSGSRNRRDKALRGADGEEHPLSPTGIVFLFDVNNTGVHA